jgi:L-histidine Nalpha-methyltransferase
MSDRPDAPPGAFLTDVIEGLSQRQKAVPARWLYDRRGSELFEAITDLPEYYPTRTETGILTSAAGDFARRASDRVVVEFGSGSSAKTPLLLRAVEPRAYVPIDISGDFLRQSAEALSAEFVGLPVHPVEADFMRPVKLPMALADQPRLGFFPGSTIGNLVARTAVDLLRSMRMTLGADGLLLIGFDRIKSPETLVPAYDDTAGVTAAFNLNLLERINRELGGDVPLDAFVHRAIWHDGFARIEMHLEAVRDVAFSVAGRHFVMTAGETIHTENSHKYGPRDASLLLRAGGWTPLESWSDERDWFTLILAEATEYRTAP